MKGEVSEAISFWGGFAGVVALILVIVFRILDGEHKIAEIRFFLKGFTDSSEKILKQSERILDHARKQIVLQNIRPDLSTFYANQWRFIEKTFQYRFEKHAICRGIVQFHIPNNSTIFLDSGSTIDLITFELLTSDVKNVKVISNNLFAAMHLIGIREIHFQLLSGRFNDKFAAVYDEKSEIRISSMPIDVYILAATAIRFIDGIMVLNIDRENRDLKATALRAFQRNKNSKLIIAVDSSKFTVPKEERQGVIPTEEWKEILEQEKDRIVLITSKIRLDTSPKDRITIENELEMFKEQNITIEYGIEPKKSQ